MAKRVRQEPDPNNIHEFAMWVVQEISTLRNEIKWVKYILYVVLALLAAILGLRI